MHKNHKKVVEWGKKRKNQECKCIQIMNRKSTIRNNEKRNKKERKKESTRACPACIRTNHNTTGCTSKHKGERKKSTSSLPSPDDRTVHHTIMSTDKRTLGDNGVQLHSMHNVDVVKSRVFVRHRHRGNGVVAEQTIVKRR